jgi:hypothetical protein
MKVTILHVRDPDSACSMRVFVDGLEVESEEIDVDAGCGYDVEDWEESIAWAEQMPDSPLRDAVLEAYGDPPGSEYICGWDDREVAPSP